MGLDMYLSKEKYLDGLWPHRLKMEGGEDSHKKAMAVVEATGIKPSPDSPGITINYNVAYWRKANQIHAWFVSNIQGGKDDCRKYDVTLTQLRELKESCQRVLKYKNTGMAKAMAKEHLPPQPGFFFGQYDINEWYWQDIESTIAQIDEIEAEFTRDDGHEVYFEYQSSW